MPFEGGAKAPIIILLGPNFDGVVIARRNKQLTTSNTSERLSDARVALTLCTGCHATHLTSCECPWSTEVQIKSSSSSHTVFAPSYSPSTAQQRSPSHTQTLLSLLQVARKDPDRSHATLLTSFSWPSSCDMQLNSAPVGLRRGMQAVRGGGGTSIFFQPDRYSGIEGRTGQHPARGAPRHCAHSP